MVHYDKRRHKQCKFIFSNFGKSFFAKIFFSIFGIIGLHVQDKLERTLPLLPAREKMVVDSVRWSQGAENSREMRKQFSTKNSKISY